VTGAQKPRIEYRCSFCGKSQEQVHRLISGPGGVYICDKCIDLCREIIGAEAADAAVGRDRSLIQAYAGPFETVPDRCPLCGKPIGDDARVVVAMYERDVDPVVERKVIWRCHERCYERETE
jgi:hypothetical protein